MSKLSRDSNCQDVKIAKKVLVVKNPRAPQRDPKVQEIHAIQVSKSFLKKSALSKAELSPRNHISSIVKGPLFEPLNLAL